MKNLKLRKGVYLPDVGIDYPTDDPYARLVPVRKLRDLKFDDTYTYLDDSLSFRLQHILADLVVYVPLMLSDVFRYGMRFRNRKVLRKYRREFAGGVIAVCNHCYPHDGAAVARILGHRLRTPMLQDHFNGDQAWYLKYFGGIPVPDDFGGLRKFNEAFDEIHRRKEWILVFPEARNWHFYKPVKPFRKGAFTMAYKYGVPVLPLNISYRERKGIYRLFGKPEIPLLTLTVGEPLFPDRSRPRKDEVERLLREAHASVCDMAGIIENPWPAFWNED
ncbi:MAG: 1-acyl-sn-glycerol-3-phosphate acyltransferase [Bacteroidales bacterium]|nr:1-acyl-sn-glycerol-3-phosphate acyltransferase [Bacteroidales bacterium]